MKGDPALFRGHKIPLIILVYLSASVNFCMALDKEFMYDSGGRRDPFLSLIGESVEFSEIQELTVDDLEIEGIIYDPVQGSMAIINGDVYRSFEFVGGFEIQDIRETQVRITKDNVVYTLKLPVEE